LREVRSWPAAVDVADAARALGISRASAYQSISEGNFPVAVIKVNRRLRVITASLIEVLEGGGSDRAASA
jgi:predicted DNA-binding transcriptional regulator AlpA